MATTARLGSSASRLSNIQLGKDSVFHPDNAGRSPYGPTFSVPALAGAGYFRADPFIQVSANSPSVSSGDNGVAYTSNVTAGSTLVLIYRALNGTLNISSVTDTLSNSWARVAGPVGGTYRLEIWASFNIASGGANTVTYHGATSGLGGQCNLYEIALGPNAKVSATGSGTGSGSGHPISSIAPTGWYGVMVGGNGNNTGGSYTRGPQFLHQTGGSSFFTAMGSVADWAAVTNFISSPTTTDGQDLVVMFTDVEGQGVGASAGTSTVSGTGLAIFEGGNILLEDDTDLLLEDGTNALLESTTDGGTGQASGSSTVSGVGAAIISSVASAAGSSTTQAVGQNVGNVTGDGTEAFRVPALSGSGKTGGQGSGSAEFGPITLSGSGTWTNPELAITQYAREDLEQADTQTIRETQFAVEDLELYDLPIIRETQFAVEDLEQYDLPQIRLTQYCVEILIPFDCDLTPPLVLPPGCPPDELEGVGSDGPGCESADAQGTGSDDDGCTPTVRLS